MFLLAIPFLSGENLYGQSPQKKVLFLSSEDPCAPAITLLDQSIRETVNKGSSERVQFYYEAQDNFRVPIDKYEGEFVTFLQRKYRNEKIDLIFALGPPSLRFLLKHRTELFPDTPIVFVALDVSRLPDLTSIPYATGVSGKMEFGSTLDIALTLHPETEGVVVVAGSAPLDKGLLAQAQKEFRHQEGKVEFTYLTDKTIRDFRKELADLPPKNDRLLRVDNGRQCGR